MLEQERKLVEEAKANPEKFGELYDRFFDQIYRYIYRRVNDKETVNDLASQTFYDALSHIKSFEWRGYSFACWLYKIAHNNVLKWYREQGKMQKTDLAEGQEIVDQSSNQAQQLSENEARDEIQSILNQLDPEEKELIRLKFFEEASNIEIAEIMGLSANHIGVKVFRALKKVKQLLNQS